MRKDDAFEFIPELIGDFEKVMIESSNPEMMYIEAALNTLKLASSVFDLYSEHMITNNKFKTKEEIIQKYLGLEDELVNQNEEIKIDELTVEFENLKEKIEEKNFGSKEVLKFIKDIKKEIEKERSIFSCMRNEQDFKGKSEVEEVWRKALRDYDRLIKISIEEV